MRPYEVITTIKCPVCHREPVFRPEHLMLANGNSERLCYHCIAWALRILDSHFWRH